MDFDSFAGGFYFFLSNFICYRSDIIPTLHKIGVFDWKILNSKLVSYKSTKSFIYFVLNIIYNGDFCDIQEILENNQYIDTIFDVLEGGKHNLLSYSIKAFESFYQKYHQYISSFPYFEEKLNIFFEYLASQDNEEIGSNALILINILEKKI